MDLIIVGLVVTCLICFAIVRTEKYPFLFAQLHLDLASILSLSKALIKYQYTHFPAVPQGGVRITSLIQNLMFRPERCCFLSRI